MTDPSTRFPRWLYAVGDEPDPRFSFANERTFLAWIRTSLALLAGGIALEALPLDMSEVFTTTIAAALIATGIVSSAHAWWSWYRSEKAMRMGQPLPAAMGTTPLAVCLMLVGIAVGVAVLSR